MRNQLSQYVTCTAIATALIVSWAGCDEKSSNALKENLNDAQSGVTEALSTGANQAREAFEKLKAEYQPQIDALTQQFTTVKDKAATLKDSQLDGLVKNIEAKLNDIRSNLGASFSADSAANLQGNIGKWMNEAKSLLEQASARIAELGRESATGAIGGAIPSIGG